MAVRSAADVLYDSEALLRWVDRELAELGASSGGCDVVTPPMPQDPAGQPARTLECLAEDERGQHAFGSGRSV